MSEIQQQSSRPADRSSGWIRWGVIAVVLVAVIGVVVYLVAIAATSSAGRPDASIMTYVVRPTDLLISITEDGNVESAGNVDLKCQVAGGSAILWIVEDGKEVEAGDKLVQLDSAQLEDQINQQKITYEKARAAMIQAEKDYSVAQISVKEYVEGIYQKELQDAEAQITIALENQRSAQNVLDFSQRMFRKGYIGSLELEGQQFGVQRAQLELDSARTAKDVLVNFTKLKTVEDLESQRETARAKMESEKAAFALEEARLERLQQQLEHCVITAPQAGRWVYANEMGSRYRGSQSVTIEEGAMLRERQTIIRLPDLKQMQVKVNVHESKVEQLDIGMRAKIQILDDKYQGTVTSVASQPESTSFFQASVKEYATIVRIDGEPEGLRPGMTAEVEILVAHLKDVPALPVAAVLEQGGKFYCWVKTPKNIERRRLLLGMSNDEFIEVKDGVAEGDEVVLSPRTMVPEARESEGDGNEEEPPADAAESNEKTGQPNRSVGREVPSPRDEKSGQRSPSDESGPGGRAPGGSAAGAGPERGPGGPAPGGGPGGPGRGVDLMQYDSDGDGKVSKQEAPERMQMFFDRIDSNADGMLDQGEIDEMRSRRPPGGGRGPGGP